MTDRDVDLVLSIQLQQVQSGNPFIDDFYYQAVMAKRRARQSELFVPVTPEALRQATASAQRQRTRSFAWFA
jgi:hypothetical protein